jgi:hypothetical protein
VSSTTAGIIFFVTLAMALVATYRPFGDYMAKVFQSDKHLAPERVIYCLAPARRGRHVKPTGCAPPCSTPSATTCAVHWRSPAAARQCA